MDCSLETDIHRRVPDPNLFVEFFSGPPIKPQKVVAGLPELRERIAAALGAATGSVAVESFRRSPSGLSIRALGTWSGTGYFAKILLADPYPSLGRFWTPWADCSKPPKLVRPVADQIETEWDATMTARDLCGAECVPLPLGKSAPVGTIVWERVQGERLCDILNQSRWFRRDDEAGAKALSQAGSLLRRLHQFSAQGEQEIDIDSAIASISRLAGGPADKCIAEAVELLRKMSKRHGRFVIPVALTHGDYALTNLLWGGTRDHLSMIDFELLDRRPVCHDLFALLSQLFAQLLNPLVPASTVRLWEKAFWAGYGSVDAAIPQFSRTLALARVFYYTMPRFSARAARLRQPFPGGKTRIFRVISERISFPRLRRMAEC